MFGAYPGPSICTVGVGGRRAKVREYVEGGGGGSHNCGNKNRDNRSRASLVGHPGFSGRSTRSANSSPIFPPLPRRSSPHGTAPPSCFRPQDCGGGAPEVAVKTHLCVIGARTIPRTVSSTSPCRHKNARVLGLIGTRVDRLRTPFPFLVCAHAPPCELLRRTVPTHRL